MGTFSANGVSVKPAPALLYYAYSGQTYVDCDYDLGRLLEALERNRENVGADCGVWHGPELVAVVRAGGEVRWIRPPVPSAGLDLNELAEDVF